jgi:hypothetical protein
MPLQGVSCTPLTASQVAVRQRVLAWHTRPPLQALGTKVSQGVMLVATLSMNALASAVLQ